MKKITMPMVIEFRTVSFVAFCILFSPFRVTIDSNVAIMHLYRFCVKIKIRESESIFQWNKLHLSDFRKNTASIQ